MSNRTTARRLQKDAAFVYGGYLLRYMSLLILIPYYGRVLGPTSYGNILAAMSLMNIVWMCVNYGFSVTGVRDIAVASNRAERSIVVGRQLNGRFLLAPAGVFIGVLGTAASSVLSDNPWLGFFATVQGLLAAFNIGWLFQGLRRFKTSIVLEAITYPLNLFFVLVLVRGPHDDVRALVGLCLSSVISLLVAYFVASKETDFGLGSFRTGVAGIRSSTAVFLMSVSTTILTSGSTYFLSILSSPIQVGYFGAAERFAALGLGFLTPAGQMIMPTISKMQTEDPARAARLARKALKLEAGFGIILCTISVTISPFFLPFVLGPRFGPSVQTLQLLSFLFPFASISHAIGLYFFIPARKERSVAAATAAGVLINFIVAFSVVWKFGALGMALARVSGEATIVGILIAVAVRSKIFSESHPEHNFTPGR